MTARIESLLELVLVELKSQSQRLEKIEANQMALIEAMAGDELASDDGAALAAYLDGQPCL